MKNHPFDLKIISDIQNLKYKTFYRWVRDEFCRIPSAEVQQELHEHDMVSAGGYGRPYMVDVPVFRPECVGESMAIDEKSVGDEVYTVFTNAKTGNIALMCSSLEASSISLVMSRFGDEVLNRVKSITRDFSSTYEAVANRMLPSSMQTVDKFHAIKELMTDLQAFRIELKNKELKRYRKEKALHKKAYQEDQKLPRSRRTVKKVYHPEKLPNGETTAELLHRSRYLLYKRPAEWSFRQLSRAKLLFGAFPDLQRAYQQTVTFRDWYKGQPFDSRDVKEHLLSKWIEDVRATSKSPLAPFADTVECNWDYMLNYFVGHNTNAIAESTNAKIQMAAIKNRGARDLDFFF
ncbi:MAG: transposase, partial [Prevotella sp.]|nr:transposase [Prevotella sp.]